MREQSRREAEQEQTPPKQAAEDETERATKFAGGNVPPVAGAFGEQAGTAQLAYEEDANERELKEKVGRLVNKKFGGDFKAAFTHYDGDQDGAVSKGELVKLLSDAGVGNGLTRGIWASKIIDKLDTTGDSSIQWAEFESVFRAHA